jgi:hypothetical protein
LSVGKLDTIQFRQVHPPRKDEAETPKARRTGEESEKILCIEVRIEILTPVGLDGTKQKIGEMGESVSGHSFG